MSSLDYDRATAYLFGRIDYERTPSVAYGAQQFKLDRMYELLARLGDPQQGMQIVHVAGTKGKGSTSAMIAAILTAAKLRTGLFTSPHLTRLEERIAIDGVCCTAGELVSYVEQLQPIVAEMDQHSRGEDDDSGPTYFELTTAMALLHFSRHDVAAAVLEVGLGGRLDSTNACTPVVSVITSISFDHTRQLGNTLAAIAAEKAGIVKPGIPLVTGVTAAEPWTVIQQICAERGSAVRQLGTDFTYEYRPARQAEHRVEYAAIDFQEQSGARRSYHDLQLALLGPHQAANAAVAVATIAELQDRGWAVGENEIRAGLLHVHSPARIEVVSRRPTIVIDTAHNVASIVALLATLDESFSASRRTLILATTLEKDVRGMMSLLLPKFDEVLLTRYHNNPRGVPVAELEGIAVELGYRNWRAFGTVADAWAAVKSALLPDHLLCVTGSFFTAAEMREQLAEHPLRTSCTPVPAP